MMKLLVRSLLPRLLETEALKMTNDFLRFQDG
jgi:hypothetical protein